MKKALLMMMAALLPSVIASPLPEKADLLASNTVTAQFIGVKERPCYFRTALCPNRCDHGMKAAQFHVLSNEAYEKPGKYGDEKTEVGNLLLVDVRSDVPGQPEGMLKKLNDLKPGQVVRLTQKHYYADLGKVLAPIRPVTELEILKGGACEEIPTSPQDPTNHDDEVMPLRR